MSNEPKLIKVHRLDSIRLDETYFTDEGYLIDHPIVTSVGIFEYKNPDGSIRRELRPPEQVFDGVSLQSYKGKPVIITHAAEHIDKDNTDEIIGTILSDGYRDGGNVRAEIIIHDTDAMKKSRLRELSLGYNLEIDETPGEWNGQPYDAIQTNIVINHLALVRKARAGEQARLNLDGKETNSQTNLQEPKGETENMAKSTKKDENDVTLGNGADIPDNPENNEPTGQTKEEKLQFIRDRKDRRDSECVEKTQSDEDVDTLLEIIEELQAKNDLNEAKQEDSALPDSTGDITVESNGAEITINTDKVRLDAIDKMVGDKIALGRLGDKINTDVWNMKPHDAKKAIIKSRFPSVRLDGKSDGYIDAMFADVRKDIDRLNVVQHKDTNYQRKQMTSGKYGTSFRGDSAGFTYAKSGAEIAREKMANKILNGESEGE